MGLGAAGKVHWEVQSGFIDDFMNCIDVAALEVRGDLKVGKKVAVLVDNQHKFMGYSLTEDHHPIRKMTEELKISILRDFYDWKVVILEQDKVDDVVEEVRKILGS